ncbi:pleckstrin homology-like domain family A member 1 [Lingula anatina]|uniref:Pleckstrin homology-like domain family A member 1 n=1 Tax=Lingula anatina TaxID=7574 RepID=A0A1S3HIQ8_LINAN|nr:pleckstrin homology-like domain family A member 1 [Lingula anatina]|eukprot:XP_013385336.1 pleckstrin homology-like domain family A member 1 [Lingula anatina]
MSGALLIHGITSVVWSSWRSQLFSRFISCFVTNCECLDVGTPSVNVTVNSSNSMSNINAPHIAPQMINQGIGYMAQPQPAYLPQPPVAYPPPPQPGGYPQQPPHNPQMARAAPDAPPPYPGGHPAQYPKY